MNEGSRPNKRRNILSAELRLELDLLADAYASRPDAPDASTASRTVLIAGEDPDLHRFAAQCLGHVELPVRLVHHYGQRDGAEPFRPGDVDLVILAVGGEFQVEMGALLLQFRNANNGPGGILVLLAEAAPAWQHESLPPGIEVLHAPFAETAVAAACVRLLNIAQLRDKRSQP